jgi:hypothetical protein
VSVDIRAEISFARWASPIKRAKPDKSDDNHDLRFSDHILWEFAEKILALVEQ